MNVPLDQTIVINRWGVAHVTTQQVHTHVDVRQGIVWHLMDTHVMVC